MIGNPPWAAAREITAFSRESGCYSLQGHGHANLYQLFAERMLQLAAPGGRVGMLMPAGLLTDHGCAPLRRHLFERCTVDAIVGFDNRDALFPIHRGVRFSLVTASTTGSTSELQTRAGVRAAGGPRRRARRRGGAGQRAHTADAGAPLQRIHTRRARSFHTFATARSWRGSSPPRRRSAATRAGGRGSDAS